MSHFPLAQHTNPARQSFISLLSPFVHERVDMNSSSSNAQLMANSAPADGLGKKVRKPYTITKSRESWSEEEHDKFLEALRLFDRDWKKIEDFVGSKTVIQIRSHAQKYFLKVQKNGLIAHVPPPRPKRKAAHPYPQKAPKNEQPQSSMAYSTLLSPHVPDDSLRDDTSMLLHSPKGGIMPSQDEYNLLGVEADTKGVARLNSNSITGIGSSNRTVPSCSLTKQGKEGCLLQGMPDFAEVYSFIGSVFDPNSEGHVQTLKDMDPINFETVLLLMRNLTINLSSPNFEPIRKVLSSYDANTKTAPIAACTP
ncbi:hypothetical protein NMG60_11008637 [Bertholletia excelsa]